MWECGFRTEWLEKRKYKHDSEGPEPESIAKLPPLSQVPFFSHVILLGCNSLLSRCWAGFSVLTFSTPWPSQYFYYYYYFVFFTLASDPGKSFVKFSFHSQIRESYFLNWTSWIFSYAKWWGLGGDWKSFQLWEFFGLLLISTCQYRGNERSPCHTPFACAYFWRKLICFYSALWCDLFIFDIVKYTHMHTNMGVYTWQHSCIYMYLFKLKYLY